ncbi:hypothetical protein SAMN05421505_103148 [Sinosporangium album]|uniref:Carbohydrate-binding module family 96 domain-containing protein n=1 Tax=Sinosporangium album TaxID=504805 RepID=A0A1G7T7R0_9ACTN|nr:DNRLRE domain-containing protein [Sinosporangium album]SDG31353.1 hypothetical protein SAMN05421505_103148 [Sinosporangium album]
MRIRTPFLLAVVSGAVLAAGPAFADGTGNIDLRPSFDAYVVEGTRSDQSHDQQLKVGFNGERPVRSFLTWDTSALAGKKIVSAVLRLWNQHSWSCTARAWEVWSAEPATPATRWPGPALVQRVVTSTETKGWANGCADGWVTADVQPLVQSWADQKTAVGAIGIKAADETDKFGWKRFSSSESVFNPPVLSVTYLD